MASDTDITWRPGASLPTLKLRAALLAATRSFFHAHGLLEVDTPLIVNSPVSDVHIESVQVRFAGSTEPHYVHTSPEYAMKRLLAAGSGDIYQICHVARALESGRHHNSEFTLIEWYRLGFSLDALMDEVAALVNSLLDCAARVSHDAAQYAADIGNQPVEKINYRQAFLREIQLDPFTADLRELQQVVSTLGFEAHPEGASAQQQRDELLDLIMGALVGPRLGAVGLTFVQGYPASQAALARLDPQDPQAALRFELYCRGIELANGFHELASAQEQRRRFARDNESRRARGLPVAAADERLLAALQAGLPDCAGVALGFDRLLMLASGAASIEAVLPFTTGLA